MKTKFLVGLCFLFLLTAAHAQTATAPGTLTASEREAAVKQFERTRALFLDSIKGLTPAQWNFKPAPERWSVAEVAEHIAVSEKTIMQLLKDRILKSPVASAEDREKTKGKEQVVLTAIVDRSKKAQAPEFLKPT